MKEVRYFSIFDLNRRKLIGALFVFVVNGSKVSLYTVDYRGIVFLKSFEDRELKSRVVYCCYKGG